jgi:F-box protein 11
VRRNRIHDGKEGGVVVYQKGRGTIEDNDIFANGKAGVTVQKQADPVVLRNRIHKNGFEAIWVHKNGRGRFEDNDLRDNTCGPWDIAPECLPNVKRSGNIEE